MTNKIDNISKTAARRDESERKNRRKWRKSAVEAWGIFYINRKSLKNPQPISSFLHYPTFHPSSRPLFRSKIFSIQNPLLPTLKSPQNTPFLPQNTSKTPQNGFKTHLFASIFVYWTIFDLF